MLMGIILSTRTASLWPVGWAGQHASDFVYNHLEAKVLCDRNDRANPIKG